MTELQTRIRYLVETEYWDGKRWKQYSYYASRSMTAAEIEAAQKAENAGKATP